MRILLASKRAPGTPGRRDGGVQTWVATVVAELRRQGHDVDVVDRETEFWVDDGGYDVGIFANAAHTAHLRRHCLREVLVVHGVVPDESPAAWDGPVAFTSEGVRDHWGGTGPVIRQPVDLGFWSPGRGRACSTLVRYANRGGLDWLPQVASRLGLAFQHVRGATPGVACDAMRDAAVVLASGRCAVEAMACGAPVVICDERHYQGPRLDRDVGMAMHRNYSGRGGVEPTVESVLAAVADARKVPESGWRSFALQHHDVRTIVPQLLEAACSTC